MNEEMEKYFTLTPESSLILKHTENNFKAEIRIPEKSMTDNISQIYGDTVITFGFLDIFVWEEVTKANKVKILLRLPTIITTSPTRISFDKETKEHVLEYYGGDKIIVTTKIPKQTSVITSFFNLVMKGKIPDDIPYNEISKYFEECARINSFNMKVNALFVDLIVVVVCRDPGNLARQFREAIKDTPNISMYKRHMMDMEKIPALTTQFSAISSGNPKYGITTSIGAVRSGDMDPNDDTMSGIFQ